LGHVLLYAIETVKIKRLIKELVLEIKPKIEKIIKEFKIDGVGFIPPTVKREVQLMREIQKQLKLKTRIIEISKIKTDIIVPQKTLNKIEDRIENAQKTISVEEKCCFFKYFLIDDAVGSGSKHLTKQLGNKEEKGICENKIMD
jgi:hypothetical protein